MLPYLGRVAIATRPVVLDHARRPPAASLEAIGMTEDPPERTDIEVHPVPNEAPGAAYEPPTGRRPIGHEPHRGRLWWSFLASGLLFIAFGIVIFFLPRQATRLVVTLLGVLGTFIGIVLITTSVAARRATGSLGLALVPGVVLTALGVATVVFADFVSKFFVVVFAVVALLGGAWDIASAVMNKQGGRWWRLARGLVLVGAGALFLISPSLGVTAAGVFIGIACVAVGVASLAIAVATRRTGI